MVLVSTQAVSWTTSLAKRHFVHYKQGGLRAFRVSVVGDVCTAAGSLYVTAKESTSHGLARRLMGILLALNPELELKPDVHALLRALVDVQVSSLWSRKLDPSVLRAIIVIASPCQDTATVLTRLLDSVVELSARIDAQVLRASERRALASPRVLAEPWRALGEHDNSACKLTALSARRYRPLATLEAGEAKQVWQSPLQTLPLSPADIELIARFRADSRAVLALRRAGAEAVISALTRHSVGPPHALRWAGGGGSAPGVLRLTDGAADAACAASEEEPPADESSDCNGPLVCAITLEPVLSPSGHLLPDTVALLQTDQTGLLRAYLYRGSALLEWLRISPAPTNPATRSPVALEDIFRLR